MSQVKVEVTEKFLRDALSLPIDIRKELEKCLLDLEAGRGKRVHSVSPRGEKPTVYTADVTSNKAYKVSFQRRGDVLVLRRVGTHRQIDRSA